MGTVYARGNRLWWAYKDKVVGRRRYEPARLPDGTPLLVGQETRARGILKAIEWNLEAQVKVLSKNPGTATSLPVGALNVARYAKWWVGDRRRRGLKCADDDEDRLEHALPVIGLKLLHEVERVHIRDLVRELVAAKQLAPRTIHHVYGVLRVMFGDALTEGLIRATPCTLSVRRRELPKKRDKDPKWRKTARFDRHEVEQLISDPRIAEDRRMMYALIFLGGPRINEMTPRRWRDYDAKALPLGTLQVETSLERRTRTEGPVKTEWPRTIPVHPTLAKMLARWRMSGWARYQGRPPTADDLIVPNVPASGKSWKAKASPYLSSNRVWEWLQYDLDALGLRRRRVHDSRRTFISMARGDGARKDLLHWVTHGPETDDIDDLYTTPTHEDLCAEVAKLRVRLNERAQLRRIGGAR